MSNREIPCGTVWLSVIPRYTVWYGMAQRDTAVNRAVEKGILTYHEFPSIGPVNWPVVSFVSFFSAISYNS